MVPTKYLFIIPGLEPRQGGVQVSALDALAGTQGRNVECIVYGTDPLRACPNLSRALCRASKPGLALRMLARRWPADVAVCWHMSMLKLLPLARGFHGKVVVFLHGIEAWRPQTPNLIRKLEKVDLFLSNSDFTWHEFQKFVPQIQGKPHITTPLGFGEPTAESSPLSDTPSILIIARMTKAEDYKGHREIISAWPQVLQSIPNARLDIVGEGDLRPELEQMVADRSLKNHVVFHGRVDEATKAQLLRACTAFAMPSRGEGFGIVYLEAMRYARPCLVSDCDAGREVVNPPEAGLQVDVRDSRAVASALTQLLGDRQQWQVWSAAAKARYEQRYTVTAYQQRLFQAIDSLLMQTKTDKSGSN
jgi:phosphatidyl-myo-inositol dimannoside synthase